MRGCIGLFASKRSVARLAPTVYNYRATPRVGMPFWTLCVRS